MISKIINRIKEVIIKSKFKKTGKSVRVHGSCVGIFKNVSIGNFSSIGRNNDFNCLLAEVKIGNHVMTGPEVMFITGDHRVDVVGRYMNTISNKEKLDCNDQDIVIEDDVWIGARCIILKGVVIGRGSVVGAGSVVVKSVKPYSIVCGVPAKIIKTRFSEDDIKKHEEMLRTTNK